jgi:G:T-mismatch repair DNA endonuclease (very short patch repair protein)
MSKEMRKSKVTIRRMRIAAKKRWQDLEYRKKMLVIAKERWTLELREQVSLVNTEVWEDPILRQEQSKLMKERWKDPGYRKKHCGMKGKHHTQDTKDNLSIANMGKKLTKECKKLIGKTSEEHWKNPEYSEKILCSIRNRWKDIEWKEKMLAKMLCGQENRPNNPEKKIIEILKSLSSGIAYVGDGTHWISGMNPDFINIDKKQIIEVFGCFWHCCKKCGHKNRNNQRQKDISRINKFKDLGYSVLIIWEHDIGDINACRNTITIFEGG